MRKILLLLVLTSQIAYSQSDKKIQKSIKKSVYFLADDKLEGRRTGTKGEKLAWGFIQNTFQKNNLQPAFENNHFLQPFEVNEGVMFGSNNQFKCNDVSFQINDDYFPLPYSKNGDLLVSDLTTSLIFLDVQKLITDNSNNPHFELEEEIYQQVNHSSENSSTKIVLVYKSQDSVMNVKFDSKNKRKATAVYTLYCNKNIIDQIQNAIAKTATIAVSTSIVPNVRTGINVAGFINNNAPLTIILGAHYDHLGYGEDHNSLYVGKEPMIHNGADDNASGTSALLALSKELQQSKYQSFNYLLVAFSGEELGLYGSKFFTEHPPVDFKNVNYMINMDMVGRLNDSTHGITIGGFGTSPTWGNIIKMEDPYFKIKVDSAGSGPSDHTSFYRKDIPILFFFTGTHSDYHKPSDDADKINFEGIVQIIKYIEGVISKTATLGKIPFSKTRDAASTGKSSFKVTMGIMPDYTFSGNGVLVDGVSDNRPAQKAGIKAGDVINQLGDYKVSDVQTYMQALNKFNKGETTVVKFERNGTLMEVVLTF
jgi:hypothetical protein